METGVVIIQEPDFTKTSVEEACAGTVLDHSSMEVDSTVPDDKITSSGLGHNFIPTEPDVVNGSGKKETEDSERKKGEAAKTISVVEEKASETENDEQGTIFAHQSESFNTNTKDAKIILSDVTLEKEKGHTKNSEEVNVGKPVREEDQTETRPLPEQEEIVQVKVNETETVEIPIKRKDEENISKDETDEVTESRTVETSVNGTETEHNVTESVEEISRNSEKNIVNEIVPEGETVADAETTKRVHVEAEKDAESRLDAKEKDETETVETVIQDPEIVNTEETTVNESESLKGDDHQKETAEPVETIKHSEDAEKISHEVAEKISHEVAEKISHEVAEKISHEVAEDITHKTEEVQESLTVVETPKIHGEDIESKASNDTEEHEHVLVRDIPQGEIIVTEAKNLDTSPVQESAIPRTLETKTDETDAEPRLDLKEDKQQEQAEAVQESNTVIETSTIQGEGMELKSSPEVKEEVDQSSKDSEEGERVLGRTMPLSEIFVTEAETLETKENTKPIMDLKEDKEQEETKEFEETASELALEVDKEEMKDEKLKADQVEGTQTMDEQIGLDSNDPEAEQTNRNKTEENPAFQDVESVEQLQKPSLESHSQVSEETSKTVDEKIEEKLEEGLLDQEGQGEVSKELETKEETVSVLETRELGVKSQEERNVADLIPLQDESCLQNEPEKETKLQKEETEKHEPTNEDVINPQQTLEEEKSHEIVQVSEEREGEPVAGAIMIDDIKSNLEEQAAETHTSLPSSLEKQEHGTVTGAEKIEAEKVEAEPTGDIREKGLEIAETTDMGLPLGTSNLVSQFEEQKPEQVREILEGDTTLKTEEVKESNRIIHADDIESKASLDHEDKSSKDTEEHEPVLGRDIPQVEAETVDTSPVQKSAILTNLEIKEDTKTSPDHLEEDKEQEETETVMAIISSDEARSSNVQAEDFSESTALCISEIKDENPRREEFVEVKSKETIQDESSEKHENLLGEQSGESDKHQENEPETIVGGDETTTHDQSLIDLESVVKMQKLSLESPSAESEETSKSVDENIEEKPEEVTPHQKGQEKGSCGLETKEDSVSESSELGVKSLEYLPNEQEKETNFQKEQIEKHEPTYKEDPMEESLNLIHEEIQIKNRDKENVPIDETDEVNTEKDSTTAETSVNGTEPEHNATVILKNIVKETAQEDDHQGQHAEPLEAIKNSVDAEKISHEVTGDREKEEDITQKTEEVQESSRVIEAPTIQGEKVESKASKDTDEHKHLLVRDVPQIKTFETEAEAVNTPTFQETEILKTSEKTINETKASQEKKEDTEPSVDLKEDKEKEETEMVNTVISSDEVKSSDVQVEEFGERTELCSLEMKDESQGREEPVEVKSKETIQDESTEEKHENLIDVTSGESEKYQIKTAESPVEKLVALPHVESVEGMQKPSLESPSEVSEETSTTVDEKIEEKAEEEKETLHQESQEEGSYGLETKEKTVSVPESSDLGVKAQEEKSDEVIQVSSASPSEEREGEAVIDVEKIEDQKANKEEHVAENIQTKLETVAEAEKIEDEKVKETEPTKDMSEKGLEISETKYLSLPLEESISDGTESSELVSELEEKKPKEVKEILEGERKEVYEIKAEPFACIEKIPEETLSDVVAVQMKGTESSELVSEFEEQKPKEVKEILEGERKEVDEIKAETFACIETIPEETLSDVVAVQMKGEDDATESHEKQEELSKAVETKETEVAQEEQTRDIGTSFIEKCSMDQSQQKEQDNEECYRDEQKEVSSTEKGETKTKPEDGNLDEHVDSSEKNYNEVLIVKTSENACIKQEEFESTEAPKPEESKEDKSQEISETIRAIEAKGDQNLAVETSEAYQSPSFVSELEEKIPKQIEEIHEEETKEAHNLQVAVDHQSLPAETSQEDQTPSLVSKQNDQTSKQVGETHEEEIKAHKLQEKAIVLTEIVPGSMLASGEEEQVSVQEGKTQETQNVSAVKETKPRESEAESTEKPDDQIERSTKVTKVEDEDTEKTDTAVAEITKEKIMSDAPENACLEQEKVKDLGTLQHNVVKEEQSPLRNDEPDYPKGEAEHGDETNSTLPVVEILKELQNTLETERAVNDSASLGENMTIAATEHVQKEGDAEAEAETLEKNLVTDMGEPVTEKQDKKVSEQSTASDIVEANMLQQDISGETETIQEECDFAKSCPVGELKLQEEHKEEGKVQDGISEAFEVMVGEKIKEETNEIAEFKEEVPADQSLTEVLPVEKFLISSSEWRPEESEHVVSSEKQEEDKTEEDVSASITVKTSPQEEHSKAFETFNKEQKAETQEIIKDDQPFGIKEEKESEEVQDEKLLDPSATRDCGKIISSEVEKDHEDANELRVDRDFVSTEVKEEAPQSVLQNEENVNEVITLEKQMTDTVGGVKKADGAEHESNEEHVETQVISDDTKINNDMGFSTEQAPKDQSEEVKADQSLTNETFDEKIQVPSSTSLEELIQPHQSPNQIEETSFEIKKAQEEKKEENPNALKTNENELVRDQPCNFEAPVTEKETYGQEQKSYDLSYEQEDNGTNVKMEVRDDEIRGDGNNSVVARKDEPGLVEEQREVESVKTGPEDAIKHEKNYASEKIDQVATKEIYKEESKQKDTVIKEEMREEEKEATQESFNSLKNTDDATETVKPEIPEIKNLSSVRDTQDKSSKQKDEVLEQQKREIADEIPKLENLKIIEELQQKGGESDNNKESEPTVKEPARKSLSDLIQKVKGTGKSDDTTRKPHIEEEEPKTEEEDDDGDEHKDDKTSPDSIVMVEAKDTVNIIKAQKKSQGLLSGVGSKVKHSISKVKKALTGKASHTAKPSSPK